ncbi:LLM class flavin-dependent oxidoreductase [Chelatococcus reniformis]|uniref:Luciferase n=1 Tax=Chelatococcus reniformis TaxID=1494448 RepID=A0A916XE86_9HYPH|nr:LLM class flavin-dependent oxidoreductase [Chelatococcus reniformis]GGC65513.1 luciferase [Chelatococcus reniformis]
MHVGYATTFQNPLRARTDQEVWDSEVYFSGLADDLGFDSIWSTEHHFTDYEMIPNPLQFLSFMAARTTRARLGTMVVVLPWHDPVRVAEEIAVLENLSHGRTILGIGRGLATTEFTGFRIDMNESRDRFVESAETVLAALEDGYIEAGTRHYQIPRRDLRPAPIRSFVGRTFGAGGSPETMPILARLGVGLLLVPTKNWDELYANFDQYKLAWRQHHPDRMLPKPILDQFVFVDEDPARAKAMAEKYISVYFNEVLKHYNMGGDHFAKTKGYERYAKFSEAVQKSASAVVHGFMDMQAWGTPAQVIEKLTAARAKLDYDALVLHFAYGGMADADAERSMRLFADAVLPTLRSWGPDAFAVEAESPRRRAAAR